MRLKLSKKQQEARLAYHQRWYQANKERMRAKQREYHRKVRLEALNYYSKGTPHCARCGITDIDVLCFDHIEGGGTQFRVVTQRSGANFYAFLKRNNYPEGYQVLCANCNLKKFVVEKK